MERLARGEFDLVAVGRPLLQDPAWLEKVRQGRTVETKWRLRAAFLILAGSVPCLSIDARRCGSSRLVSTAKNNTAPTWMRDIISTEIYYKDDVGGMPFNPQAPATNVIYMTLHGLHMLVYCPTININSG